jgi:hypothetical protein
MLTSYEIGKVKIFLHPFDVVITVVLVVTVEDAVFLTATVSREVVFVISKTLSGARSNGRRIVLVPVSGHSSIMTPSAALLFCSSVLLFSPLSSELPEEVKLETDVFVFKVLAEDISVAIKAARTSGGRVDHASKIEAGNKGDKLDDSSLFEFEIDVT